MSQTREPPILRRRKNDLPHDIVLNILTRLPAKSLIRFRCVSKTWDSSITTSYFISTHLNNLAHNHDNGDGYIIYMPWDTNSSNRAVCTVAFDRTFDRIAEVEIPFDFTTGRAQIVGSCNGLLCLADIGKLTTSKIFIYLWNPSIKKFKRLPDSCLGQLGLVQLSCVTLGFAYHPENNDYKVVRISSYPGMKPHLTDQVEVYTLSSDSWRKVGMSLRANVMVYVNNFPSPMPLVSGALHWMARVVEDGCKSDMIVSFDVNSEKFRLLGMPDGSKSIVRFQTCLASLKGKLAFLTFGQSERDYHYSMWVMREYGVLESWNQLFVVPLERISACIGFTMCGWLLHWMARVVEDGCKSDMIVSFDVNSEKFRLLGMPDGSKSIVRFQTCLASLKGKLAFLTFGQSERDYHYSMWVMREYGVLESWNQLFVVPLERISACIGFTMCGWLLIHSVESNYQAVKFVLVDTETLHEKDFDIQQPSCVATFMESLALLDGANTVSY